MHRALALHILVALALLSGCSAREGASDWVGRAETANEEADRRLAAGDTDGARDALKQAIEADVPGGAKPVDARAVRQDLYYRLATLELGKTRAREAAEWATRGLDLGRGKDVFTSNLLIVRGKALEQQGDSRGASRDYHDALLVTEALLDVSLQGGSP